jgi:hypothetical protein
MPTLPESSRRHHFVPQFYLDAWRAADDEGLWVYFRQYGGKLRPRRRHAGSIGYSDHLYTLDPDYLIHRTERTDALERRFYQPLDNQASLVHQKLVAGGLNTLSGNDRRVWAMFVNSLLERSPGRFAELERLASGIPRRLHPDFEASMRSAVGDQHLNVFIKNLVRTSAVQAIADPNAVAYFCNMDWTVVSIPPGADHFLTGDRPVVVNVGKEASPILSIALALDPKALLVMCVKDESLDDEFFRICGVVHNALIADQTTKYLLASEELHDTKFMRYSKIAERIPK